MDTLTGLYLLLWQAQKQLDELVEKPQIEINETQNLINAIMECESGGNTNAVNWEDAKITGYPSRGLFQFQYKTWIKYAKIYKVIPENTNLTEKEANKYIHIPVYNNAVAHGMIKDGLAEANWTQCYRKYERSLALK